MKKILYLEIYDYIIEKINSQTWLPNFKIPSKRKLSQAFNVSLITVQTAIEQLESEGYIYSKQRVGYFVSDIEILSKHHQNEVFIEQKLDSYAFDFTNNNGDIINFPFDKWQKIERRIIVDNKQQLYTKPLSFGEIPLREAIANYLNNNLAMNVSYKQIVITSGSDNSYNLLVSFFGKEKIYGLEDPGYQNISAIYKLNKLKYKYIPLDEYGIDINKLKEAKVDIAHISTNHHYPSGIVMPISRRYSLIKWANDNNAIIIEDDYDVELRLKGKLINPLFSLDDHNVVYLNTFSLTLNPGFRIAYLVLPKRYINSYEKKMAIFKSNVSMIEQLTLAEFINSGAYERFLNKKKKRYQEIRNHFIDRMKTISNKYHLILKEADLGLHVLITYPYKVSDDKVGEIAQNLKININLLSHFMHEKKDTHTLIINYTSFNKDNIDKGIDILEQLIINIKKFTIVHVNS